MTSRSGAPGLRTPTAASALPPFIFGDCPIDKWPEGDTTTGRPWDLLIRARRALDAEDSDTAIGLWREIAEEQGLESRQTLQSQSPSAEVITAAIPLLVAIVEKAT